MAFKKALAQRLFNISRAWNQTCRLSTPSSAARRIPPPPTKLAPDPGDDVISRRFLQWRSIHQSTAGDIPPAMRGEKLLERLRGMGIGRDRIRLDGLIAPTEADETGNLTVEDARKVLRVSQLEVIKSKIREINTDCVLLEEFIRICSENCGNRELGLEFAKMLDESGHVIVLGKFVFLRPEQVVKVIQGLIPLPGSQPNDPRWKEFKEMQKQKSTIDRKAESLVRRELWCGLGYLIIQTAAFMRLTFWELTWDVMEPICFYVTSAYFMAGYAFFLRTKIEPSFEGFFQSRFDAKQKRLMKKLDFNVERYNELLRAFNPGSSSPRTAALPFVPSFDQTERERASVFH